RARLEFWLERIPGMHNAFGREVLLLLRPPAQAAPDAGLPLRVAVEALARAAELRPVLLWLDDVHWSRGEAAALLDALASREQPLPICVIATARVDEVAEREAYAKLVDRPAVRRVRLDRLDRTATRYLVQGLLEVDDELCDFLAARAEGNPLFAAQLLQ